MSKCRSISSPFECHICGWGYVDIIGTRNGFKCKCRKCKAESKVIQDIFESVEDYKNIKEIKE